MMVVMKAVKMALMMEATKAHPRVLTKASKMAAMMGSKKAC